MNGKLNKILGYGFIFIGIIFFILSFYDPVKLSDDLRFAIDLDLCSITSFFCALPAHAGLSLIYIFLSAFLGLVLFLLGLITLNKNKI